MLITEAEYNDYIRYEGSKTDPRLSPTIAAVTNIIHLYLGYEVGSGEKTEKIRTIDGRNVYYLSVSQGVEPTSATYKKRIDKQIVDLDIDDNIFIDDSRVELVLDWAIRDNDIVSITYTLKDKVMDDIKQAALMLTRYYMKDEYVSEVLTESGNRINYIVGKNIPPHVATILDLHRSL